SLLLAGFHRLAGLDALGSSGSALGLDGRRCRVVAGDSLFQFLGLSLQNEAVDNRCVVTGCTGIGQHGLLLDLPAIPNPDWHSGPTRRWSVSPEVEFKLACFLADAVEEFGLLEDLAALGLEQLRPLTGEFAGVAQETVAGLLKR